MRTGGDSSSGMSHRLMRKRRQGLPSRPPPLMSLHRVVAVEVEVVLKEGVAGSSVSLKDGLEGAMVTLKDGLDDMVNVRYRLEGAMVNRSVEMVDDRVVLDVWVPPVDHSVLGSRKETG